MDDRIKTAIKLTLIALLVWALWWIGNQWLAEYRMIQKGQEVGQIIKNKPKPCSDLYAKRALERYQTKTQLRAESWLSIIVG